MARRALGGVQGWWVLELKLGAPIYRQIDGVAVNGESPASDYGGAGDWQVVWAARQHQWRLLDSFCS